MKITKRHHNAALAFANRVRKQMGKRPVTRLKKGIRRQGSCCTLANTIGGVHVNCDEASFGEHVAVEQHSGERLVHRKNKTVRDFIIAFDEGLIPELELRDD